MGRAQTWEGVMIQMKVKTRTRVTITQSWTSAASGQSPAAHLLLTDCQADAVSDGQKKDPVVPTV